MEFPPNLTTVIFEILNFLVLAILLTHFLFKPVLRNVQARTVEKAELLRQLQQDRQEAVALRATLEERLSKAEEESLAIKNQAQQDVEAERLALLRETRMEVERVLVEAHTDACRVRQQAVTEFHEELLDTILDLSGQVVGQLTTAEQHAALVKQLSDRIWTLGRSEMQRVEAFRSSLGDRIPTAYVTSARPLSPESQGLLARTFTALADRNVNLDIKVDPALSAGVRVRIGDLIVDTSVAGQLADLRESVAQRLRERASDA